MKLQLAAFLALCLSAPLAGATDVARLQNGFSIRHESREVIGTNTRLYLDRDAKSFVDVATADIVAIEHEPDPAPPAAAPSPTMTIHDAVTAASGTSGLDPDLIDSVIKAESNFDPNAVSRKGARGLMQLMPATAGQLGVTNSFDPQANVDGGSRYLRELLLQYDRDLAKALAAYNAGPGPVDRYHGVPPYRETYSYVSRVIADFNRKKLAQRATVSRNQKGKSGTHATIAGSKAKQSYTEEAEKSKTE